MISPREIHNCAQFRYIYLPKTSLSKESKYKGHWHQRAAVGLPLTSSLKCVHRGLCCVLCQLARRAAGGSWDVSPELCNPLIILINIRLPGPLISCAKHLNLPGFAHRAPGSGFTSLLITAAAAPGGVTTRRRDGSRSTQTSSTPTTSGHNSY